MVEKSIGSSPTHLVAGGDVRLAQTLHGSVPTIESVGILAAGNPSGRQADARETIRRNAELLHDLATYPVRQVRGQFGKMENPCVVSNLPRARLVELGVKYAQDAVIFARRKGGAMQGMGFELICTNAARGTVGHVEATRKMVLQDKAEFVIGYQGCRFEIPFFDEDPAHKEDFRGGRVLTYHPADIPAQVHPQLEAYLAAAHALEDALRAGARTGHHLYRCHGVLSNARTALFAAMGDWKPFPLVWERAW